MEFGIGTKITHPKFGEGVIIDNEDASVYGIYFKEQGEKEISKEFEGLVIVKLIEKDPNSISFEEVKRILQKIIDPLTKPLSNVPIAEKWKGGMLSLKPGKSDMQGKEIPLDTFFHKIVMVRDRLRVMEQKINSSDLSDADKVDLQQYVTRVYGSLTTFNVLFADKDDYFVGTGGGN